MPQLGPSWVLQTGSEVGLFICIVGLPSFAIRPLQGVLVSGFTFSVHLASITIGSTLLHGGDPGFPDMRLVWRGIPAS